jgi:two-component system, OmpR family, sensor histidine kinase BaeS
MTPARALMRLHPKLLLSYLVVIGIGIGIMVLAVGVIGPDMFDNLLGDHMGNGNHDVAGAGMSADMQQETRSVFRTALMRSLLISTGVAIGAAVLVSAFVAWRITQPIKRIAAASTRIARGDYHERVPTTSDDELGDLVVSFNEMAAQLEAAELQRVYLIGDVAHEIRTPLTTLRGNLEGMIDGVIVPEPELLARLYDETTRINRLIDDLQELSRVESHGFVLMREPIDPAVLIERSIVAHRAAFVAKRVVLISAIGPDLPVVRVDADRIGQVLSNLLSNALRHTPGGGSVTIAASATSTGVEINVRDTGSGIAPEHLPKVFDRFYRADAARSRQFGGSGIGLTIARALVEAHRGTLRASSRGAGQGATFTILLPNT